MTFPYPTLPRLQKISTSQKKSGKYEEEIRSSLVRLKRRSTVNLLVRHFRIICVLNIKGYLLLKNKSARDNSKPSIFTTK